MHIEGMYIYIWELMYVHIEGIYIWELVYVHIEGMYIYGS